MSSVCIHSFPSCLLTVVTAVLFFALRIPASAGEPGLIQVIHNSADTTLRQIDVYLNGEKILGKMAFRTATPFVPVASDHAFQLAVTRSGDTDTLLTMNYRPEPGIATAFVLHGVADTAHFQPNPDGKSIRLQWTLIENITTKQLPTDEVAVKITDGCIDLAATNLIAKDVAPLLPNLGYGGATPSTIIMPPTTYEFLLLDPQSNAIVRSFTTDITAFAGNAVVLFISGFAGSSHSSATQLGIYAALRDGSVVNAGVMTSVHEQEGSMAAMTYRFSNGEWHIDGLPPQCAVDVFSLLGQRRASFTESTEGSIHVRTERGITVLIVKHGTRVIGTKLLYHE
ncbi:MAG: hypothetical protein U0264_04395 [Candidatus Kapaibacterium sp.]